MNLDRRKALQMMGAAAGALMQPGMAVALTEEAPATPAVYSALFATTVRDRALDVLLGQQQKLFAPPLDCLFRFRRFAEFCENFAHFLLLDPKDWCNSIAANQITIALNAHAFACRESGVPPSPLCLRHFTDSRAVLEAIYGDWEKLKAGAAAEGVNIVAHLDFSSDDGPPPAWLQDLDERGRLDAWIEARFARLNRRPLGFFLKGSQLTDLLRCNLEPMPAYPGRYFSRPPGFFREFYGPHSGDRIFLQTRTALLEAEGLGAAEAQNKATCELRRATYPPVLYIARDESQAGFGMVRYNAELVFPENAASDNILLFKSAFLIDEQLSETGRRGRDYRILQNAAGLVIAAAKDHPVAAAMEALCKTCHGWRQAYFDDLPYSLAPLPPGLWQNGPLARNAPRL